jgi:uncharacterized protein YdeI (YjbR/CyaY-like superfamily)
LSEPLFFDTPDELRAWFDENHETATDLVLGLWKSSTGRANVTWSDAVSEALCVGWIDGRGQRLDDQRWAIRFTPRKARSTWSAVNIAKMAELEAAGRVRPAGARAFAVRSESNSKIYSHEQAGEVRLPADFEARFRADTAAWAFFEGQAPSYRKAAIWWVISAKREATKESRLATLITDSAADRRIPPLARR